MLGLPRAGGTGGAEVLDINMGMSGIDEKEMMLQAITEMGGVTSLPLSIDSSHVDVLEAALRRYPGRALINSISMESEKFEKLLPIAKKYGAMFILLPLSDAGLPKNRGRKDTDYPSDYRACLCLGHGKRRYHCGRASDYGRSQSQSGTGSSGNHTLLQGKRTRLLFAVCPIFRLTAGAEPWSIRLFWTMAIQAGLTMAM